MFRKSEKVTFYASEDAYGLPQPYPAYKQFPEWFGKSNIKSKCPFAPLMNLRKLVPDIEVNSNPYNLVKVTTIKHCPGIVDSLKTGYILPAWSDMCFRRINGMMKFESAVASPELDYGLHRYHQFSGMSEEQRPEMGLFNKLATPWYIKTSPGTSVFITHPYWERNKTFTSVTAVIHTDVNPLHLKWFFEFNQPIKDSPELYDMELQMIKKDTPLMLIIPFKRQKYEYDCELLSHEKMSKVVRDSHYNTVSWVSQSPYERFRRILGNLYR